jgi:alkylation response protein AidB-like acyl-CoA dehydrogenase
MTMGTLWRPNQKYNRAIATEDDLKLANVLHNFVDDKVMPRRRDLDGGPSRDQALAQSTFHELITDLVHLDIQRAFFPEEIGGLGLTSRVTSCMICEELARGDIGLATTMTIIPWAFTAAFLTHNQTVIQNFARPFCGDEHLMACLSMTEPPGGCNIEDVVQKGRTIETIAELDGDEWVINGQKLWPSGAGISEVYATVCTTDPNAGDEGITIIYVPKNTPGLTFGEPEEKMGLIYTDVNSAIFYEDVRVPRGYCCGAPGGEGAQVLRYLANARVEDAALSTGAAQAVLEIVTEYTGGRFIQGKPVREQSLHAAILGEMAGKIHIARSSYMDVASMYDQHEIYGAVNSDEQLARASAIKNFATQTAIEVMHQSMELMGSYGYSPEYHVEKYLRDIIIIRLWLGGVQLGNLDIARGHYPYDPWSK